jgi:hypothetical protein
MPSLTLADLSSRTANMADAKSKKKWVQAAVPKSRKGVFKEKAEHAGMSTRAYAEKEKNASSALGKEARLATTLMGMHKRKRSVLHDHPRSSKD